jgi:hypothetical protein
MNGFDHAPWITFDVTGMSVTEPPPSLSPATLIPNNRPFVLSAKFTIDYPFGKGLNDLVVAGQPVFEYNITYFAESIGPGSEWKASPAAILCIPGTYTYDAPLTSLTVPPLTLAEGPYRLACTVKISPRGGGTTGFPLHVTAFVEGPMIEIYVP